MWLVGIVGAMVALAGVEFYALNKYGRAGAPPAPATATAQVPAKSTPVTEALAPIAPLPEAPAPEGWLDEPVAESIVGNKLELHGWAVSKDGIARVEVRVGGRTYAAKYGDLREDVGKAKPGFPDNPNAGFAFQGDFADLSPMRHDVTVVAIAKNGRETVLARRSLIPPAALTQWKELLDERPKLASRAFYFLMMTSGSTLGGVDEIREQYADYESRTQRIGMSVPLLYMRTTKGRAGDWSFDPGFDLSRKCAGRRITEDNLNGVLGTALAKHLPVNIILNGGIWGDASCETPEWDLTDHLEQDRDNCQWDQNNEVHPDNFVKDLTGSVSGTQLSNSLTYNIYAKSVRDYKRRNLKEAARRIATFMRAYPELMIGVTLDADTYMNPFLGGGYRYDFNPGMLRQFREWLQGTGPYAGRGGAGVPDLRSFRRPDPLTLAQVNKIAGAAWKTWDEVDPPRKLVGVNKEPFPEGAIPYWEDPWYLEWDAFRKHVVHLHYIELAQWVHEEGIPGDRIFTAQAFTAPDPGLRPVSLTIRGPTPDYDSAGVSIEGSVPRVGHLGTIMYGVSAEDRHGLDNGRGVYSNIARFDEAWAVVEYNAADLKMPKRKPPYESSYRTFRSMFNYDGRQIAMMAWNGSNGIYENDPDYLPYTAFRSTPSERAMKDSMIAHADLPRGARLWTFGAPDYITDDGWTATRGAVLEGESRLTVTPKDGVAELVSPPDQVIRTNRLDLAIVRSWTGPKPRSIVIHAREHPDGAWVEVGRSSGSERVALRWPASLRGKILSQFRADLAYDAGVTEAIVNRIVLYPANNAYSSGVRGG